MASRHATIRDAVHTAIAALTFSGISAGNIVKRKISVDRSLTLPGIVIAAAGRETVRQVGNAYQVYGYPISVVLHQAANQSYTADDTELQWRETIVDAFDRKGGAVVSGVQLCEVEFGEIIDLPSWMTANLALSFLTIRCYQRHVRS